jgi:hypothetical protein
LEEEGMKKNQMFKKISAIVIEAPHPTLVAFGISAAIVVAVGVGLTAFVDDHSHMAHALHK